jgi:phosphomannomutase / phosphoglucomutase
VSAWKACDLRGVFPRDVSADLYRRIGRALATRLAEGARVVVAGDFRLSTPELKSALTAGLAASGAHVLDAGQIPTPIVYFAHRHLKTDAVCIVTASHNPPDHNGLKLMVDHFPPSPGDLASLRAASERGEFRAAPGVVETVDPLPAYRAWMCERWAAIAPGMHVVLDAGNGAAGVIGPALFDDLGFRVERLFCEIDGRYPNRAPDSSVAANLGALCAKVRETGARLGIAWDGDGDRVAFADESGSLVSADEMAVLLVRHLAPAAPGRGVVYDLKLSDVVRREAERAGAIPRMERSGHAFIKSRMIRERCVLGCEASGHYFFDELDGGDDGIFGALLVADMVAQLGALGELRRAVPPFFLTPDIRLRGGELTFAEASARLRALPGVVREVTIDGLRVETEDGFILVRESVTETALTLRMEGRDAEALGRLRAACRAALPEVPAHLLGA